jgi:elongation factor P
LLAFAPKHLLRISLFVHLFCGKRQTIKSSATHTLNSDVVANVLDFLVEGSIIQLHKFNGNPIGLPLPEKVELEVVYTEGSARGDTSGNVTKLARLQTGLEIKAPLYTEVGERVKVYTETREFAGRA